MHDEVRSQPLHLGLVSVAGALLQAPAWAFVQGVLPFLLFHAFSISPALFALFLSLKPACGLVAPLWQNFLIQKADYRRRNLQWSGWLSSLPFLLLCFFPSPLLWILAAALFLTLAKGRQGVWAEVLRCHVDSAARVKITAWTNAVGYGLAMALPFGMGFLLDCDVLQARWIALGIGICLMLSGFLFCLLPQSPAQIIKRKHLPIRDGLEVLRLYLPFRHYQLALMLAGAALVLVQPAIAPLLTSHLKMGYADCALYFGLFKAVGYLSSSPLWNALLKSQGLMVTSALAASAAALFLLLLQGASLPLLVGIAYLLYGFMQCGSELVWQLAPLHFSQEKSALPFASVSIFLMGIRGLFLPALGAWAFIQWGQQTLILSSLGLSLGASLLFWRLVHLESRETGHTRNRGSLGAQNGGGQPHWRSP